jgi:hypothetical protein
MLAPKKVKYRKIQKGRVRGTESRGTELAFGEFGLKSTEICDRYSRTGSRAYSVDASYQARRAGVDPGISGQAIHQKAG